MHGKLIAFILIALFTSALGCEGIQQPPWPQRAPRPAPAPETAPTPAPSLSLPDGALLTVTASRLNLRACAGRNCQILKVLSLGQRVVKQGQESGWLKVKLEADGSEGWLGAAYVKAAEGQQAAPPAQTPPPKEEWAAPRPQGGAAPAEAPKDGPAVKEEFSK
ncbi:MAG: SH3 domain-containing protein [Desulfarculus sp.]|nr:MAG: SH3 domain-containing protein [Desulfarculus sp.]